MSIHAHYESPAPESPQYRFGTSQSGELVPIEISSNDRLEFIKTLPERWQYFMKKRESGVPYETLVKEARADPEVFREALASIYSMMETYLHDLAQRRAQLIP